MAVQDETLERSGPDLEDLIAGRVVGRHILFFVTSEGDLLPDGTEAESGFVIDERGRVFAFWTGWDGEPGKLTLETWEQVEVEPFWPDIPEYSARP